MLRFQDLRDDLNASRKSVTSYDEHYQANLAQGNRNKFQTLRAVRAGNTKRRIDIFENL